MKKYELTKDTKTLANGTVLHRIRALKSFRLARGDYVRAGALGDWVENEDNLSQTGAAWVGGDAWVSGNAKVFENAQVCGNACVSEKVMICGDALIKGPYDYAVFKNTWSSGRFFTYTRSNKMWKVGCFYGTGEELIAKAYKDSKLSGQCYKAIVKTQEAIDKAVEQITKS